MQYSHFIVKFIFYILAMTGIAFLAIIVWRKTTDFKSRFSNSKMKIEDSLNLAPRKNLYIVRIENERFLIASDVDKTTFLSKLENSDIQNFNDIQQELKNADKDNQITNKIKLKPEEQKEEPKKEKPINMLKDLLEHKGLY